MCSLAARDAEKCLFIKFKSLLQSNAINAARSFARSTSMRRHNTSNTGGSLARATSKLAVMTGAALSGLSEAQLWTLMALRH